MKIEYEPRHELPFSDERKTMEVTLQSIIWSLCKGYIAFCSFPWHEDVHKLHYWKFWSKAIIEATYIAVCKSTVYKAHLSFVNLRWSQWTKTARVNISKIL